MTGQGLGLHLQTRPAGNLWSACYLAELVRTDGRVMRKKWGKHVVEKDVGEGSLKAWGKTSSVRKEEAARHARAHARTPHHFHAGTLRALASRCLSVSFCSMLSSP